MMEIGAIAFDLDDTLCDYQGVKESALLHLAASVSHNRSTQERFIAAYKLNEPRLFKSFLTKTISLEDYRAHRFSDALISCSLNPSPTVIRDLNVEYMRRCNREVQLFPESLDVLHYLFSERIPLALITNGPADGQRTKILSLGIGQYFDAVLISGEVQLAKPDARIFEKAAHDLNVELSSVLMVGDSLIEDYRGALNAGAQSVLIDREGHAQNKPGTQRITNLKELLHVRAGNSNH